MVSSALKRSEALLCLSSDFGSCRAGKCVLATKRGKRNSLRGRVALDGYRDSIMIKAVNKPTCARNH